MVKHPVPALVFFSIAMFAALLPAQSSSPSAGDFLRFERLAAARAQLQTSVRRYRLESSGQVVSLVGAVHIADREYYREIQEELDSHDLTLFEMVGDPDHRPDPEIQQRLSSIGQLQMMMEQLLEFTHQMHAIDYKRKNLRHADLTGLQFARALREKGLFNFSAQGLLRGIGPAFLQGLAVQAAMRGNDDQSVNRLRWQMAKSMTQLDTQMGLLGVEDIENPDDLIIGIRNDHAWKVLEEALPEGHRRIAIFYGAAHLPDFQRRLLKSGWVLEETRWIGAWNIPKPQEVDSNRTGVEPIAPRAARL